MADTNIKPLNGLYNKLRKNGAQLPDEYDNFEAAFTLPGKAGAENRHKLYNQMAKDGLTDGDDYSTWYTTYFQPISKNSSKARDAGTKMTKAERNQFADNVMGMYGGMMDSIQDTKDNINRQIERSKKTGLGRQKVELGKSSNVAEIETGEWDTEKGAPGKVYATETGDAYTTRFAADQEQNALDEARYQREKTEEYLLQKKARLTEDLDRRAKEIDQEVDEHDEGNWFTNLLKESAAGGDPLKVRDVREGKYDMARKTDTKYASIQASLAQVDDALDAIKEGKKGKASNAWIANSDSWYERTGKNILAFGAGSVRGLANAVGKVSTWDNGASDLANANATLNAVDKAGDNGENMENLSTEERDLLNLTALSNKVQEENEQYMGYGYKAGQVTGISLPMMIEMRVNPLSKLGEGAMKLAMKQMVKGYGKQAMKIAMRDLTKQYGKEAAEKAMSGLVKRYGKNAIDMTLKNVVKKYGKEAVKRNLGRYLATKIGARVVGDALGAAGMAATTGIQRVGADALQRMTGNIKYGYDAHGKVVYFGVDDRDTAGDALIKGFLATSIENHSELLGEYLKPFLTGPAKLISKGFTKMGWDGVNRLIKDIGATDFAKMISHFESKAKWHGTLGEYTEEVLGNIENALLVGDQTLDTKKGTGVFNLDNNIETLLGVGLLGGVISTAKTVGYRGRKRETLNKMAALGSQIDRAFAGNQRKREWWGGIRNQIMVGNAQEKHQALREALEDKDLPFSVRYAIIQFATQSQKYEGIVRGLRSKRGEDSLNDKQSESYERGYAANEKDMAGIKADYDKATDALCKELGIPEEGKETIRIDGIEHQARTDQNAKVRQLCIDYLTARAAYTGMIEHVQDNIKDSQDYHEGLIDSRKDETGNIQRVTLKEKDENGGDRKMYLTKGKVVMTDDGTMVNVQASDKALTVVDEQGRPMMVSPKDIFSVDAPVNADEEKKTVKDGISQERSKYYADIIEGVTDADGNPIERNANTENAVGAENTEQTNAAPAMPKMGEKVELTDKNGNKTTVTVQAVNADGYEVTDGNRVWMMPADEMRNAMTPKVENAQANVAEGKTAIGEVSLSKEQAGDLLGRMEANAEKSNEKELTAETWSETFDENNSIETPIGRVKMGDNQITKFFTKNRAKEFGMVAPTLKNPDVIIEEHSEAKDGNSERPSSYIFVKTFDRNGKKIKFYASITVKQDGMEVSISSHYMNKNAVQKKMQEGKVMYIREALLPNSSEWHLAEHQEDVPDLLPTQGSNVSTEDSSAVKVNDNSESAQENAEKKAEKGILIDKNGKKVYDQSPIEATVLDLYDGALDDEEIAEFVNANIAAAEKEVAKATAKKPKMGTDKEQYLAAKEKWNAAVTEAKRKAQYWNDVKAEIERITTPDDAKGWQDELSGKNARELFRNNMVQPGEASNAMEITAEFMQYGDSKITPESFRKETGFGIAEQRAMVGRISKNGKSIERLGEELASFDDAFYQGQFFGGNATAARDAIIDYLMSYGGGRKGMKKLQEEAEDKFVRDYEADRDNKFYDQYNMSYEEYLTYSAMELPEILRKYSNFDEQGFYNRYADEIEDRLRQREEELNQKNNGTERNDTTREEPRYDRGHQVQSGERTNDSRRGETGQDSQGESGIGHKSHTEPQSASKGTSEESRLNERNTPGQEEKSERENGNQSGNQTERKPLSKRMRMACEAIAKAIGVDIEWVDHMDANGEYEQKGKNGRPMIRIALDAENPLSTVFGHEGTHAVRNLSEEAYQSLVKIARAVVGEEEWRKRHVGIKRRYRKYQLSEDGVTEEVVCDIVGEMITDHNMAEQIAYGLDHPTLSALRDIARKLWEAVKKMAGKGELTEQEQAIKDFADTIERAFVDAKKKAKEREEAINNGVSSVMDAANADAVGGKVFNVRTEKDVVEGLRNYLEAERNKEGSLFKWTDKEIEEIMSETADLITMIHDSLADNHLYDEWAKKEPTLRIDWRDGEEKPTVTWARNNIEYKYDVSADLLCINNEGIETVLSSPDMVELMIEINKSHKKGYTSDDYMRLYETMRDLGLNVPCKGCFDAAMRLKMLPSVARKFVDVVNATIDKRNADPEKFDANLRKKAGAEATANGLPTGAKTKADAIAVGVAGDNLTEHISWTQLMSAEGQTKALSDWGGIFRAWQRTGAGRPKDKLMPEPYSGVLTQEVSTIIAPYGEKTPSFRDLEVNQGTGLRRNSHSEFRPLLAIDEIQFMRDAFFKNLCVFKYMKELDDVRLFGKMGVKFNMSFFPAFDKASPVAGLDINGDYIASEESVGSREFVYNDENGKQHFDGMRGLQEAEKHVNEDVSLSSVIFSVPHLIKALTDVPTPKDKRGRWGSLIPFHASGATLIQLFKQGLGFARGLKSGSFIKEAFTDYGKGVTNFEDVQNDRFGKGWRIVSGKKKGTKVKEGHKIEFANGNHYFNEGLGLHLFSSWYAYDGDIHPEDRKLLMDPTMDPKEKQKLKNKVRKYAGHDFVVDYNDKVRELGGDYAYKSAADYYLDLLPKLGLIPRFEFQVPEDVFLQMCKDAKVDPTHPKLGWKGEGHGWSPTDSDAYYSLFCDYGMTNPATGKWSPHRPVGYIDENGNRTFKLPDNTVDIVREGANRYTEQRDKEAAMHNEVMEEYVKRTVADGKLSQKQGDDFMERMHNGEFSGKKLSLRSGESEEGISEQFKLTDKEKDDATKRIDERIAELHRQKENSSHNTVHGNLAEPLSQGKYSPTNVGAQGENSRIAKLPKGFKSAKEIAKKLSSFVLNIQSRNDVNADNFTKKLVESLQPITNQESDYVHYIANNGDRVTIRFSDHNGNARNIIIMGKKSDIGYSFVVRTPNTTTEETPYKANTWAKVLEFVYKNPSKERLEQIAKGIFDLVDNGEYTDLADADEIHPSPRINSETANTADQNIEEDDLRFRLLDHNDPKVKELESLPEDELVPVYRNVQVFQDDALGSPMAFTDAETGERRTLIGWRWNYSNPPQIKLTDKQQQQLDELNKNGYIMVDGKKQIELKINDGLKFIKPKKGDAKLQYFLKKNSEDSGLWADYNPYDHAIETPLNTQFASAYKRPNLVVVRCLIPKSEIDNPYHADYAAKTTGAHEWNNGRTLYLSRWSKIDKVLTRKEEAELIDKYWKANPKERNKTTHRDYNRFVPQVRRELEKMGYRFEYNGKVLTPEESLALDKQNWENRDVIPGQEGSIPFVSNEDIERINAKMAGEWIGETKESTVTAMVDRVNELSEMLHTPMRIIQTEEEVAQLPSSRQRRSKGSYNTRTGEVTVVVPNNANVADVENTVVHEVVGHDGLRLLFHDEATFNHAMDELYRVSESGIRQKIDADTQKMYDAEVERIMERKRKEHEAKGENANATRYTDMAEAHVEASKKRDQLRRVATEEYGSHLAGRIGIDGFERMSAEEKTFWGRLKAILQKALDNLLQGLNIKSKHEWTDKDWAYVLHESYKRKKNGGKPSVFDMADTEAMRQKTGFGESMMVEGELGGNEVEEVNDKFNEQLDSFTMENADKINFNLGNPSAKLLSAGVADKPIRLHGSKIAKKMKKHGFSADELRNLPKAIANPIAVFDNLGKDGNRSVLTELKTAKGNFLVAIDLGKGTETDFDIVRSVFGKKEQSVVDWINNGYLRYVDKEKALDYLHLSAPIAEASNTTKLSNAAKLVEDFENPKVEGENFDDTGILFRDGDAHDYDKARARDEYERKMRNGWFQTVEALQDSMLSLMKAMQGVLKAEGKGKMHIEDVAGFENAYLGENRLSSVNLAEEKAARRMYFDPLMKEVARIAPTADERAELTDYMMAKHGLERNEVMARRAAEKKAREEFKDELRRAERAVAKDPLDQDALDALDDVKQRMADRESDLYFENRGRDYAGLTALTETDNVADAEAEARKMVADYEKKNTETGELWKLIDAVNGYTLERTYESGIISEDTYNDIKSMYQHYIPLRGFDETTSDEVYAYTPQKGNAFSSPIKTAKGRKSKADDPFANMQAMMDSAIVQGNRNTLVKQKFLNFVMNHPSDLFSVSDVWLAYDNVADEWKAVQSGDVAGTEKIKDTDTPAEVEQKLQNFEAVMEQLVANDPKNYAKQSDAPDIPYRVVYKSEENQHQVIVMRNGKKMVITVNGNPRVAQALNGQTNPDSNQNKNYVNKIFDVGQDVNRKLANVYTSLNPDFVVSNYIRDMLYANTAVHLKENEKYAWTYNAYCTTLSNPAVLMNLYAKLKSGKLDEMKKNGTLTGLDESFYEFIMNGGETGFTNMKNIEKRKKDLERQIKKYAGKLPQGVAWDALKESLDFINESIENSARFAAFLTSRKMGRTIDRSIWDAKEASVNFNKKGAGDRFMGANGQTKAGNVAAFVSGAGRGTHVFWNAALQGTVNVGRAIGRNKAKSIPLIASLFGLGLMNAMIAAAGGDDDDNGYYDLPEYVRRSNIMFRFPGMKQWIAIPLSVEYRAVYGLGELAASTATGNGPTNEGDLATAIAEQTSQLMPLDFMEGGGGLHALWPSWAKPAVEAYSNQSWTGQPIYKDNEYNKTMPEWTKAYKSANKYIVWASKNLNEATGGDDYKQGKVDINPARIEYLLSGYAGGLFSFGDRLIKTGETMFGDREYDPKNIPFVNRVVKQGDERTKDKAVNNRYFNMKEEAQETNKLLKGYTEASHDHEDAERAKDYREKLRDLKLSPEYRRFRVFQREDKKIEELQKRRKDAHSEEQRNAIDERLAQRKRILVGRIADLKKAE